ncbi:SNF2 family helicase/ATPase PasG [Cordyceps fumosorosea ARSEF 2679]|uniref:SNF2 family helicase/ATPase PasG n=1 Tax=Cordyceps fumosorosea (strain ARSEF 2679) TaxID=1081104 RepID=A0A167RK20_CORFA|nr:SNF2 family helicase/ATPase PasG [Cordyceps fumosorosea ARSEF 2679]OAA58670.1 SNF2 family helicase/ATPase PasG [Cordyceps fumosorosea ARSEF 2679]
MDAASSSDVESIMSKPKDASSPASSPPPARSPPNETINDDELEKEEEQARIANNLAEEKRRQALARKRKTKKATTKAEREAQARQLDELLMKSAAFSDILTKKTQVLGRVGSGLDGQTLGEHDLQMAKQPKCMVGGKMRDYQLEGLTWMFEICSQGMSGILADEMGLGKTVQTISLIALLREQENYLGPHLIVAPLSTLSNWMDEFQQWTPSIPVVMYHGKPEQRQQIFSQKIMKHMQAGRPTERFPVVCTSYEMVLQDKAFLSRINWEFIIIDEGHRMKNAEAKLFQELRQFTSATRLLITGTPLQNNLKELWSLLHFLLPNIFTNWESFESWFDFSGLEDEEGTQEFIQDKMKQDLVKKMHLILQPLLLRRIKQDVAAYLPRKREYVLFAPMTKEQTDLYNVLSNKNVDTREFLQKKVEKHIMSEKPAQKESKSNGKQDKMSLPLRGTPRNSRSESNKTESPARPNAFTRMMGKATRQTSAQPKQETAATPTKSGAKRKNLATVVAEPEPKSARSSRGSTPASTRGRPRRSRTYKEADSEDDDELSDAEFEAKLVQEMGSAVNSDPEPESRSPEEIERAQTLELAKKQIAAKRLGNTLAQHRLVCNSPHNFYNPWAVATDTPVDESIVTASGKMLLLDRLLHHLFAHDHKVLIFSQFAMQLDILEDYCRELRGWPVCRIDGSVSQASRRDQIRRFSTDSSHRVFLLSTRAGGQGINLAAADTVVLFDSDFNPQQDLQAQDRAHRIGQQRPVVVYRLATRGTVEERLLLAADAKRRLEKLVIRKGGFRTMGQKMEGGDGGAGVGEKELEQLLLKDGQVFETTGGEEVLSEADLEVLCDRSDAAYEKAASGEADEAEGYCVVETGADSIKMNFKGSKE